MLLRHQPRYDYYSAFFKILQKYKKILLASPIPTPKSVPVNASSGDAVTTAALLPCTDTDPAHRGLLDASQLWDLESGALRVNFTGASLCVDALKST